MDRCAQLLMQLIQSETVEEVTAAALPALVEEIRPETACLLLWDAGLNRHIVGDTWLAETVTESPAAIRRQALAVSRQALDEQRDSACEVLPGVVCQPLQAGDSHVGALVVTGAPALPSDASFLLLISSTARVLHMVTRLQQADRESEKLSHERERLEQLLKAVERQQIAIDRLLLAERELSASLEAKVEERTAALWAAQQRLIQSEKLAVIGQLASSLAHELNNPLQAIQSGLGLALVELEGGESQRARSDLQIIQQELERIDAIFRQMMDFYRPVSFDNAPLDLNAICEAARILMHKRLAEAGVALHLDLVQRLPRTCGDSNQIKQVLLNLMLNAVDAMPSEGGNITLRTEAHDGLACLSVIDDGSGITPEHQTRLFEPLFTTKTRGLGLGLAISQEIAQRHQGEIVVQSRPGGGSIFTLKLPVQERCQ